MFSLLLTLTSMRCWRRFTLMFLPLTTSQSASAYFLTPKMTGSEDLYWMSALTPCFLQVSSARYMIFIGAPAHLMGLAGKVKTARPPWKYAWH